MNVATVKHRLENHTLCKQCVLEKSVETADLKVHLDRSGLCTDFVVRCNKKRNPHQFLMCQPVLAEDKVEDLKENMLSGAQIDKSNIATRPLNHQLVTAMMCTGNGWTEANLMMTLLGAECGISFGAWQKLEESLGMEIQEIAEQILDDNLQAELALSEELDDGGIRLECSFDTGWTGATNRNYNSPASIATLIGCKTKKIIAITVKAKVCGHCEKAERKGVEAETHFCTKNHEGSSKSMEASSAVDLIVEMHARGAPVYTLVGDDDSTVDANIGWSFEEMQKQKDAGNEEFADFEWPRDKNGKKMKSSGQLPLHFMQIHKKLADPTHRTKCATKKLFKAAGRSKKNNVEEMSKRCAMRIKTNFGYFVNWTKRLGLAEMMRRAPAVVEHHFGDHTYCGPWCKFSIERPAHIRLPWDEEAKKNYKDKKKHASLYKLVRECMDPYLTEESLAECAHEYDSQTNEACNKMFTKYAPKTTNFSRGIGLTSRVLIGTTVHSIGDLNAITTIYENMGFAMNDTTSRVLRKVDARKKYFSAYVKTAAVKRRRAMKLVKKKAALRSEEAKDKKRGMSYGVDATKMRQPKVGKNGKVIVRKPPTCKACKKAGFDDRAVGHRSSSRLYCPEHPKYDGVPSCRVCGIDGHEHTSQYHCPNHPLHKNNVHHEKPLDIPDKLHKPNAEADATVIPNNDTNIAAVPTSTCEETQPNCTSEPAHPDINKGSDANEIHGRRESNDVTKSRQTNVSKQRRLTKPKGNPKLPNLQKTLAIFEHQVPLTTNTFPNKARNEHTKETPSTRGTHNRWLTNPEANVTTNHRATTYFNQEMPPPQAVQDTMLRSTSPKIHRTVPQKSIQREPTSTCQNNLEGRTKNEEHGRPNQKTRSPIPGPKLLATNLLQQPSTAEASRPNIRLSVTEPETPAPPPTQENHLEKLSNSKEEEQQKQTAQASIPGTWNSRTNLLQEPSTHAPTEAGYSSPRQQQGSQRNRTNVGDASHGRKQQTRTQDNRRHEQTNQEGDHYLFIVISSPYTMNQKHDNSLLFLDTEQQPSTLV